MMAKKKLVDIIHVEERGEAKLAKVRIKDKNLVYNGKRWGVGTIIVMLDELAEKLVEAGQVEFMKRFTADASKVTI